MSQQPASWSVPPTAAAAAQPTAQPAYTYAPPYNAQYGYTTQANPYPGWGDAAYQQQAQAQQYQQYYGAQGQYYAPQPQQAQGTAVQQAHSAAAAQQYQAQPQQFQGQHTQHAQYYAQPYGAYGGYSQQTQGAAHVQAGQPPPQQHATPTSAPTPSSTSAAPAPAAASGTAAPVSTMDQWPADLRKYVEKVFSLVKEHTDSSAVEKELQAKITRSIDSGDLWTRNWSTEPLPSSLYLTSTAKPEPTVTLQPSYTPKKHERATQGARTNATKNKKLTKREKLAAKKGKRVKYQPLEHIVSDDEDDYIAISKKSKKRFQVDVDPRAKKRRLDRFAADSTTPVYSHFTEVVEVAEDIDWDTQTIKGTSTTLEKPYLRLTAPPAPETVRPQRILEKSLKMMKRKWKKKQAEYLYLCEQLKSIRQDLTVQRIQNDFTVEVYETHARIALENSDLGEFCQCHTQLQELYRAGNTGNVQEFTAYAILYYLYSNSLSKLENTIATIDAADLSHPAVAHALEVREAMEFDNYHRFFKLYNDAPNMGAYLMDAFLKDMRIKALRIICRAYKPSVPIGVVQEELSIGELDAVHAFLEEHKVPVSDDGQTVVTKI